MADNDMGRSKEWWLGVDALRRFILAELKKEREINEYTLNRTGRQLADLEGNVTHEQFASRAAEYRAAKDMEFYLKQRNEWWLQWNGLLDQFKLFIKADGKKEL